MELLSWLEQLHIWRIEREHGTPKTETVSDLSEDDELPVSSYPTFNNDQAC